tara:strand:+ start:89 stop:319 length:231 start_codon:yes stop_codon:yes gene_type:complete
MGKRTIKKFNRGDLVKWYEVYNDVYITKDYGTGIVMERMEQNYGFIDGPVTTYRVYRLKYSDIVLYGSDLIEEINE